MDVRELIGLSEEEAIRHIYTAGYVPRILVRDGVHLSEDTRSEHGRVSLEIEDDKVTSAYIG